MNFVPNLNEVQREEIITKCKESLRSRVSELESAFQEKDKQFVELTDKYMNEKNLRVTAETSSREAESKLEDMQNTLNTYQDRVLELESELARHYETLTKSFSPEQGTSERSQEMLEHSSNTETLYELRTKYMDECNKTLVLQDRIVELEQDLRVKIEEHEAFAEDSQKQKEWLSSLLERERQINENLSTESDLRSVELQKHLEELTEENSLLNKRKSENNNNGKLLQELTETYRFTVNKLEIEKLEIHKKLQQTREELNLLQNERNFLDDPGQESDGDDPREVHNTPVEIAEQIAESSSPDDLSKRSKKSTGHANAGYRARLSRMIQEGLQKFRNNK